MKKLLNPQHYPIRVLLFALLFGIFVQPIMAACSSSTFASQVRSQAFYSRLSKTAPGCPLGSLNTIFDTCPNTEINRMHSVCAALPSAERTTCKDLQDGLFYKRINTACNVLLNTASATPAKPIKQQPAAAQPLPAVTQTNSDTPKTATTNPTQEQTKAVEDALKKVRKAIRLGFP